MIRWLTRPHPNSARSMALARRDADRPALVDATPSGPQFRVLCAQRIILKCVRSFSPWPFLCIPAARVCSFLVNNSRLGESQEKSPISSGVLPERLLSRDGT